MKKCAITGAGGYIGSRLTHYFRQAGWIVYELKRNAQRATDSDEFSRPYSLEGPLDPSALVGLDALIHCAYDFRLTRAKDIWEVNVKGSLRLVAAARSAGLPRIVLISTISAFKGCQSLYGQAKLDIEKEFLRCGGTIIRPGVVYGESAGGMFEALNRAVRRSRVLPLVGGGKFPLYLVHEEDLCRLVLIVCSGNVAVKGPLVAASDVPESLRSVLGSLARSHGRRMIFIPVPWRVIWALLKIGEALGLPFGFRSDSLLGLVHQNPNPDFEITRSTGVQFRQLGGGIQ